MRTVHHEERRVELTLDTLLVLREQRKQRKQSDRYPA